MCCTAKIRRSRRSHFSPNSCLLASGCVDGSLKLWDVAKGLQRASLPGHTDSIDALTFSSDGARLISGGRDKTIMIWELSRLVKR
jgi:WD40 repeat protein